MRLNQCLVCHCIAALCPSDQLTAFTVPTMRGTSKRVQEEGSNIVVAEEIEAPR